MRVLFLVDNNGSDALPGEWGLSIWIEYGDLKFLLDAGQSDLAVKNAKTLGIDLSGADAAVLSHAHYDHADGMIPFFAENSRAKLYVRESCGENCWKYTGDAPDPASLPLSEDWNYIGIPEGLLENCGDRIVFASGDLKLAEGVWLIPHKLPGREALGRAERMYRRILPDTMRPDDFSHEQSLVFETPEGLVIFNSCSHGGADNIIREIRETFPGKPVRAMIGGFHLYNKTEEQVRAFARRLKETGVTTVCSGHCTGDAGIAILREVLGDEVFTPFRTGLTLEF